jgi:glycosyltransferase involved in cell wall biosynthesis
MGGAEVALLNILASIKEVEPEWKLNLIVSDDGVVAAKARALGVTTSVLPFPRSLARIGDASTGGPAGRQGSRLVLLCRLLFASVAIAIYTARLRSLLRQMAPEVIHTNGFKMHILGALAKPSRVPLIWHIHDYVSMRPFMAHLVKMLRKRCSLVLANSNSVGLDIKSVCGDEMRVQTLNNGVDTLVFSPEGSTLDLDSLSGLPKPDQDVVRVGLLATLARWKGHKVFLRALSLIPPEIPWRGYIIGAALYQTDGSQCSIEELKTEAQQLGISDSVGFPGFIEEPAAAMRSLDVVVHASTQPEPFGLVIIEAMACGRALVASSAGGAAEIIDADVNALSHPPGDAAILAEKITSLATSPELRKRLGLAGRETVERRFGRSRLATELIAIYQRERRYA